MRGISPTWPPRIPAVLTRRNFLAGSIATGALFALYANEIARHELQVTHQTFHIPRLPPAFFGFRIVQISDIHLEEYTEDFFLREVIARVNQLQPDLLLVTGDFVSRGPMPIENSIVAARHCAELLATLTCPQKFGVLGNHDVVVGGAIIRRHLEDHGLPLLVNQFLPIERDNQRIILCGLDDFFADPDPALAIPEKPDAPVILMVHEPDYTPTLAAHRRGPLVDLILSGHTHGGQIRLPGVKPLQLPPAGRLYPEGRYLVGASQLYVNRGIGTVGIPLRLNCPPEITVITLQPTPTA